MKQHTIQIATVLALLASSAVNAQQAVQWRVSAGGNGHWYKLRPTGPITWPNARLAAESQGGHLATLTSEAEKLFAQAVVASTPNYGESAVRRWGPWLGGYQDRDAADYAEPTGGWRWVTGETWSYAAWLQYQPDNWCAETQVTEEFLAVAGYFLQGNGAWNDLPANGCDNDPVISYVIEWDTDCNADGIVDYGQCHNGTLPDYNGNNVPDCCERSETCVVGHYPVQWRFEDGGNGHWYELRTGVDRPWVQWRTESLAVGGDLASLATSGETEFLTQLVIESLPADWQICVGGFQNRLAPDYAEPAGGWRWVSAEAFDPTHWCVGSGNPSNSPNGTCVCEDFMTIGSWSPGCWNDVSNGSLAGALTEWSIDCNNDGIVDYGQILAGQFADTNSDGIPDNCQCGTNPSLPTCCPGDLDHDSTVGGADIGLLLSNWGPCGSACLYDLNNDDKVNGGDLGLLLAGWGPCSD